jgi:hypothetical protein
MHIQTAPKFEKAKAEPFGTQFATRLESVNNKLVCAMSAATPCHDDHLPPAPPPNPPLPDPDDPM